MDWSGFHWVGICCVLFFFSFYLFSHASHLISFSFFWHIFIQNTTAQLDALDSSASHLKAMTQAQADKAFEDEAAAAKLRQESRALEGQVEAVRA